MDITEAAAKWGVHSNTVLKWCRRGLVRAEKRATGIRAKTWWIPGNAAKPVLKAGRPRENG